MKTLKTAFAFVLAAGLNTAAFAQTTPTQTMPTNPNGSMQTTPGSTTNGSGTMQTTPAPTNGSGTMQTTPGMNQGSMQTTPGTTQGSMRDGTTRTRNLGSRTMKTKADKG